MLMVQSMSVYIRAWAKCPYELEKLNAFVCLWMLHGQCSDSEWMACVRFSGWDERLAKVIFHVSD